MSDNQKKRENDDFWNLDGYIRKRHEQISAAPKRYDESTTKAIQIELDDVCKPSAENYFSEAKLTSPNNDKSDQITCYIASKKDKVFSEKYIISEYSPDNPLIKNVKIYSDKPSDSILPHDNLFMRERRALLNKKENEQVPIPYYSYSPRYSNMSKQQIRWYLWWRENFRQEKYLPTDECYLILYLYELVCAEENEDFEKNLDLMCKLLNEYKINIAIKSIMCSLVCDFCLVHALPSPISKLNADNRKIFISTNLPEFFIDFSNENRLHSVKTASHSLSIYNYKKSKIYSDENSDLFDSAIGGAISEIFRNQKSFRSIISFTDGAYGSLTVERYPFQRLVGIVNKRIKIEITYFQLSSIQSIVTDAVRYSENKLREHLGIKNKLHILAVNPNVKEVIDEFFSHNYPAIPMIDKRKKDAVANVVEEAHEYDRLYDLPKVEISAERAMQIERDSWNTTKILTEAFKDDYEESEKSEESKRSGEKDVATEYSSELVTAQSDAADQDGDLYFKIEQRLGILSGFLSLCKKEDFYEQRKFAVSQGMSTDSIADKINEAANEIFGDIILENDGSAYKIIEDYIDLFQNI